MRMLARLWKELQSVLSSRPIVIVAVCSAAFILSPDVRADNQKKAATMAACCGPGCGTAGCDDNAQIYYSTNRSGCFPGCFVTAILVQPDSSVSAGCGVDANSPFRFVRKSSPCTEDVGNPFSFPFPLNSPFPVTNAQWLNINDSDVVVEVGTDTVDAKQDGQGNKTSLANPTNVPAASTWGLLVFGALVLTGGTLTIRNRGVPTA